MVGSLDAAGTGNGEAAAIAGGRFRRFLFAGLGLTFLAACSTAPATPPGLAGGAAPIGTSPLANRLSTPRRLTGLSAAQVVALLGEPDFRRDEPPAELWQYRGVDCVLDLFLYRGTGGIRVLYSETRERSLLRTGGGDCAGGGDAVIRHSPQTRL